MVIGLAQAEAAPPVATGQAAHAAPGARAEAPAPRPADQTIRATLATWVADFNAGRADRVCSLFATDLRATYRGYPERNYQETCDLLRQSLTDEGRGFNYGFDVQEVLVSGDLAVARLVWQLTITPHDGSVATTSQEPGMDVFRRQADGSWKIIRYLAFEAP
jgi:steroid delta-isomerase